MFIILLLITSCESAVSTVSPDRLEGVWLGGAYELDQNFQKPFSQFLEFDDSMRMRYLSGSYMDTFQNYTITNDSIHLSYRSYALENFQLYNDILKIGRFYPSSLKKINGPRIQKDSAMIVDDLISGQWVTKEEILDFKQDTLWIYNKELQVKEQYCWSLYDQDGYKLLQRTGSFKSCAYPFYAMAFIHGINKDTLILEQWRNGSFATLTYKKESVDFEQFREKQFKLCDPFLYENSRADWYFFKYASFEGGLYNLSKVFSERYVKPTTGKREGYVKVQFVINCEGEIGMLEALDFDKDFMESRLNPVIRKQILTILPEAGRWIPGERRGLAVDTYKYLIFKIEDGEISEIYP